jgi:type II secretory pathway component PulM
MEGVLPEGVRGRFLAAALTVTVLAVLWVSCVQPLVDWHAERADTLDQRRALLQRMTALVGTLPELQRQSSGEHAPTAALLEGASDAVAGAALQTSVQRMATSAGAELSSMEMLSAEQRGAYRRIAMRVATAASWPVLVELLREIEQATPRMLVDDLQMRAPPVELRAVTTPVSATFTIVAFRATASGGNQ